MEKSQNVGTKSAFTPKKKKKTQKYTLFKNLKKKSIKHIKI